MPQVANGKGNVMTNLVAVLESLGRPRVLVAGDLILDRYTCGDVNRVSPEAPVLIRRADRHEVRPAALPASPPCPRALDASVTLAGTSAMTRAHYTIHMFRNLGSW